MITLSKPDITENEINAVISVLKSGQLSLGPKIKEFESLVSKYSGTKYASAVCNGTCGLHLIVRGLLIGFNDAVFVPSFTFIASANCFLFEGAYPIFVDIERDTYNLDPKYILKYIEYNTTFTNGKLIDNSTSKHIKAIVGVHVFGHPFDVEAILEICKKYNLFLIEDSAESLGSEYKGKKCGQFGEASIFAFYPNKQITTGEGGIITTNNLNYYKLYESLKNQGRGDDMQWLTHDKLGFNYRLSDINATIGIEQMKRIDEIIEKRNNVANLYKKYLGLYTNILKLPIQKYYCTKLSIFVYVIEILVDINITDIIDKLSKAGIQSKNYFSPIHLQKFYKDNYGFKEGLLPITEEISKKTLAIPFYNDLSEDEIKYVSNTIIYILTNNN